MARAATPTKLPLDRWAQIFGISPLHFSGVYLPDHEPTVCEQPWLQHEWQAADRVSREEVARAIADAEQQIEQYLHYRLMPSWEVDEWQATIRPYKADVLNLSSTDVRGFASVVPTDWGHIISGGIRQQVSVEAGVAITYSDEDGDGYEERATITVATTLPACELHVYLPGQSGAAEYEIRPIAVTDNGATVTIRFRREQALKPSVIDDEEPPADDSHLRGIDGSVDGNFETTVDVYREYNDPIQQVHLLWEPFGLGCSDCGSSGCSQCAFNTQTGCLMPRGNPRLGIWAYRPATWNATTLQFDGASLSVARQPDMVRLWYYAGLRDKALACPTRQMPAKWERAVAYFAAALLARPLCDCNNIKAKVDKWQRDRAGYTLGDEDQSMSGYRTSERDLTCPLGTTVGAIYAWRTLKAPGVRVGQGAQV